MAARRKIAETPAGKSSQSRRDALSTDAAIRLIAEGNDAEAAGNARDACAKYRTAVDVAPYYAPAHLNLGVGLEAVGDYDGAVASYQAALAVDPENPYANYNLGKLFHARGIQDRAEQLLRAALDRQPDFPEAHVVLSNVYDSQGKLAAGIAALEVALRQRPEYVGALYNYAAILRKLGRLSDAETALRRALALESDNLGALRLLAEVSIAKGNVEQAIACCEKILGLEPSSAGAYFDLGNALFQQGRLEDAAASYRKAIVIQPGFPEAHSNLGNALREQGRLNEAIACYRQALALKPGFAEAHSNLGNALRDLDHIEEAVQCYRKALSLKPDFPEARTNLGHALLDTGCVDDAISCYHEALALDPDYAGAHSGLGNALKKRGRSDEALACYRKAVALKPDFAEAHYNLGNILGEQADQEGALECYRTAISLSPDYAQARWALVMSQIPAMYDSATAPALCRAGFSRELENLERWFDSPHRADGSKAVGVQTPFYLAYQEEDNRELLRRYGDLCARIMKGWLESQSLPCARARASGNIVRVGIVSKHFQDHSVWHAIVRGWFRQLDRSRFAIHAFHTGLEEDQETAVARARAESFEHGEKTLRQWVETIADRQLDVLIYPEIGMDTVTAQLASLRLAPVQVTTWGHPETSGLPTIDHYLSAEDLEPADARQNYAESLTLLPHLGCFYERPQVARVQLDLEALGIDAALPLLLCPGSPFKYAPQNDRIFPEVAHRLGRCKFIFFLHKTRGFSDKLRERLRAVFASRRMDIRDFVTFIPWQSWSAFYGLLERAHVYLDTIGFSGFNTAMQGIDCGIPIVTREGRFLRGRLASGILRRLGLHELVAQSEEEYIALAVRLARDRSYRDQVRRRIEATRHVLFEDTAPIRAMERFITAAVGQTRSSRS